MHIGNIKFKKTNKNTIDLDNEKSNEAIKNFSEVTSLLYSISILLIKFEFFFFSIRC